jgi:hypothetical protein
MGNCISTAKGDAARVVPNVDLMQNSRSLEAGTNSKRNLKIFMQNSRSLEAGTNSKGKVDLMQNRI